MISIQSGAITRIASKGNDLSAYELEPQLITSLFDSEQRSKREIVRYDEIPKVMVDAVLAIEDRRFFEHSGINFVRMAEAALIDITHGSHKQGGSTLTMQLSRGFFLSHPDSTYFNVGRIGQDQLQDQARRRGADTALLQRLLAPNL